MATSKKKKKTNKLSARLGHDPLAFIQPTAEEEPAVEKPTRGRPKSNFRVAARSTQKGVPEGWERATYVMREDHVKFLRDIAWLDRKKVKDVMEEAVEAYIKKHGSRVTQEFERIKSGATTKQ